mgnify:CR=1 FL=1
MCGIKIDTLLCLITHQLQSFSGGLLFCLFFTSAAAFADYITVEMDFNNKVFVVVRTAFTHENIFKLFAGILLDNLLQSGFIIVKFFLRMK